MKKAIFVRSLFAVALIACCPLQTRADTIYNFSGTFTTESHINNPLYPPYYPLFAAGDSFSGYVEVDQNFVVLDSFLEINSSVPGVGIVSAGGSWFFSSATFGPIYPSGYGYYSGDVPGQLGFDAEWGFSGNSFFAGGSISEIGDSEFGTGLVSVSVPESGSTLALLSFAFVCLAAGFARNQKAVAG
jgi:hypothetical protein